MRIGVVGAGWAGLAAAVTAAQRGHRVALFEMAARPGGRARTVEVAGRQLDNGQHILIGAYTATLALMRGIGLEPDALMLRQPLRLAHPDGGGLRLPPGDPRRGFARAVLGCGDWTWPERLRLLATAFGWAARGFRCAPGLTVDALCASLSPRVRQRFIDPLCVAALNTPSTDASAATFLRVLRDAMFGAPGAADVLLPRVPLGSLLPEPALRWLAERGHAVELRHRVERIAADGTGWRIGDEPFDAIVLATTATEAARLAGSLAPGWAGLAAGLQHEPIVTVYLEAAGTRLPAPMLALPCDDEAPAQFAFDRGDDGLSAFVISGAARWVEEGSEATGRAVVDQARRSFAPGTWREAPRVLAVLADKRATFRCTPGLQRPPAPIRPGLVAAGDYVAGPYPAVLEGAVRSGIAAIDRLTGAAPRY